MSHLLTRLALTLTALSPAAAQDLIDIAQNDHRLTTLVAAVQAADLVEALQGDGPFTLLAPTNEAFAKLGEHAVSDLLKPENKGRLVAVLTNHVISGKLDYDQIGARSSLTFLSGQRATVSEEDNRFFLGETSFETINSIASNGYVHNIDEVLLPVTDTVVDLARGAGSFQTLLAAVETAGLAEALIGPGPFTVLAPTDEAFAALGKDTIASLLEPGQRDLLTRILQYHVIPGRVFADQSLGGPATTLAGADVEFAIRDGRLVVGDAQCVATDLQASNGVVHVIDAVLMPPAPRGRLVIGYEVETPSRALSAQLGIDRSSSKLVTKVTRQGNGLQLYDVITEIEGQPYSKARIDEAKGTSGFGGSVKLTIIRAGQAHVIEVSVGIVAH